MSESFRERFLKIAGDRPYAWAVAHGLSKGIVSAVLRSDNSYKPIRRTLWQLSEATGRSRQWWLTGETTAREEFQIKQPETLAYHTAHQPSVDPLPDGLLIEKVVRAIEQWIKESGIEFTPERKGAMIALLVEYTRARKSRQPAEERSSDITEEMDLFLRATGFK